MSDIENIDLGLVRDVNNLWKPVYAGIARQVAEYCTKPPQRILEIGCFSGGTGIELLRLFEKSRLTVALDDQELVKTFFADWTTALSGVAIRRIHPVFTPLMPLSIADDSFDLVFCRGVFFFLDGEGSLLKEAYRAISPGGIAFVGGGFGSYTPDSIRASIADESREKNNALGRKLFSLEEFQSVIIRAGLMQQTTLIQEGGLWALMKK